MPLMCLEKVRFSCDIIIVFIINIVVLIRYDDDQNGSWINKIMVKLIIINRGEGIMELNDAGSKAEKMSDIMQNMEGPFRALKALSLFNLIFYIFVRLSQYDVIYGFVR